MWKKMGIQKRLLISYAVLIAMLMVAGLVSILMLEKVGSNLSKFYDYQHQTIVQSWTARQAADASMAEAMQSMLDSDPTITKNAITSAQKDFDLVIEAVTKVYETYNGEEEDLEELGKIIEYASPLLDEICTLAEQNRKEEAYEILKTQYKAAMDSMREWLAYVGAVSDYNAQMSVYQGQVITVVARSVIVLVIAISVITGLRLGFTIADSIRKPVEELKVASENIAGGQLNVSLTYDGEDELGALTKSMQLTVSSFANIISDIRYILKELANGNFLVKSDNLNLYQGDYQDILIALRDTRDTMDKALSQINTVAEYVDEGSSQVAYTAQELSKGTAEQVDSVDELVSTVADVVSRIELASRYANEASMQAKEAGDMTAECNDQMKEMLDAMNDISNSSEEIKNIIGTIEAIASKTKTLALNASIEAARAGDAGRGFAVVAEQVRDLAAKSSQASQSTVTLIAASLQAVERGVNLANTTANKLQSVSDNAIEIADMVGKIAINSQEQTAFVEQISVGIDQISEVTQTASASSEESAATSEELSRQARMLKELVGQFKLRNKQS